MAVNVIQRGDYRAENGEGQGAKGLKGRGRSKGIGEGKM